MSAATISTRELEPRSPSSRKRVISTMQHVRNALDDVVKLQTDRERLVAERDHAMNTIAARYNAEIAGADVKLEAHTVRLEAWLRDHPELMGERDRSLTVEGHRFGWRKGKPRVQPKEGWSWDDVLLLLNSALASVRDRYLRTKVFLDKQRMAADRGDQTRTMQLAQYGVEFVQDETFYVEPAREGQQPARITAESGKDGR